jgi:arylsulfatase A-like enzyme
MDSQIRELVRSLRARGLYDNSLLIITSDHGEALGRRNQLRHAGISAYQNEIGVPLLVKYPGAKSGGTVNADAAQVDLLPTVLDVLSIVEPPGLQGISLRTLEREPSRFVVSVSYPHQALVDLNPKYARTETAVILGDKKLIESSSGERELFDLSRDRDEDHNLYHEDPSDTLSLTHMLDQWIHDTPAAAAEDLGAVDRNTVERLKSLGYAQ